MDKSPSTGGLQRILSVRDLIFYGIVVITPIAPVPIYGVGQEMSRGHLILCLALAGVAMMLTAFSYGRMATLYPSAGSAYVYVGRGLAASLGFVAGWTMTLDYVVLPIVAIIQAALAVHRLLPAVPYALASAVFVVLITALNLRGMRTTARTNICLLAIMAIVIAAFLISAVRYISALNGLSGLFSLRPFYHADSFELPLIATATSFAALTYIGFDGVTTLAEDVSNPARNVPLATVVVCLFTTLFSCILVYFAQLIVPDYRYFSNIETAFMDVTRQVGGDILFQGLGIVVILSSLGAALGAEVAAARVLLVMGRDNVLPRRFGNLDTATGTPTLNILVISGSALVGSLFLSLEHAGELLNFGALLGFMGVNLATLRQFYFLQARDRSHLCSDALIPAAGFVFCLAIWLTLPLLAKLIGGAWLLLGLSYYAVWRRRLKNQNLESPGKSTSPTTRSV